MFKEVKTKTKQFIKYATLGATCCTVVTVAWLVRTYRQSKEPPQNYSRPIDF